jgi:hypothetical protein
MEARLCPFTARQRIGVPGILSGRALAEDRFEARNAVRKSG